MGFCVVDKLKTNYKRKRLCQREHFYLCPSCNNLFKISTVHEFRPFMLGKNVEYDFDILYENKNLIIFHFNLSRFNLCEIICPDCSIFYVDERKEIIKNKIKSTNLSKYGVENTFQAKECKEKIKQVCLERYGVDSPMKNETIRNKAFKTYEKKSGYKHPSKDPKIKNKKKKTCRRNYGVDSPLQSKEILKKVRNTNLKKYGVPCSFQSKEVQELAKKNNLKKYGVPYTLQIQSVRDKIKNTCKEKYNCDNISQVPEIKEKVKNIFLERYGVPSPLVLYNKNTDNKHWIRTKLIFGDFKICTRSSWETVFALFLWLNKIDFEYESLSFSYKDSNGVNRTYIPDFYLPEFNYIVELKGLDKDPERTTLKGKAVEDDGFLFELINGDGIKYFFGVVSEFFDLEDLLERSRSSDKIFEFVVC